MKISATFLLIGMAAALLAQQSRVQSNVIDRFVGTWKEDQSKRKLGSQPGLRFRRTASGGIEELRGPDAKPDVQAVNFDGKPHEIGSANSIVWKQIDANTFERTLSDHGKVLTVRRIRIAPDGKTLTEETERKLPNGKSETITVVAERASGDAKGLVGTWRVKSQRSSMPDQLTCERASNNGMKCTDQAGVNFTVALDNKPSPYTGPAVLPNMTIAARQVDDQTIELTLMRQGTPIATRKAVVSKDGKTMTSTTANLGPNASGEPTISVFEKQ